MRRSPPADGRRDELWALGGVAVAFALWYLVFAWPRGMFWVKLSVASSALAALSLAVLNRRAGGPRTRLAVDAVLGAVSAAVLWLVFWAGGRLLILLFGGAQAAIRSVYAPRAQASPWAIALLLLLVTGPAEEIFWRGLVQRVASSRLGRLRGLLLASVVYAAVHVWTLNGPLMLAALVAGVFWGALFLWRGNLTAIVISHSLWGVMVFVLMPLA